MKLAFRVVGALVLGLLVLYAVQMIAAESGEVVVLTTTNEGGTPRETRLWVVDHAGSQWLRSGSDIQSWYANIRARPQVEVIRNDVSVRYTAVPVADLQEPISRLMAEKYGWADRYIGFLFGRAKSVPIRLDPR